MPPDPAEIRMLLLRRILDMPTTQLVKLQTWLDAEGMEPVQREEEKNHQSGVEPPHSILRAAALKVCVTLVDCG